MYFTFKRNNESYKMELNEGNRQYYPALDGLRGFAILLVVLYHNFSFLPYLNYGWLGVDLFFVLSGFLITQILCTTVNSGNYFRNFYVRRVLRIFPLYYLFLILFLILLPLIPSFPLDMSYYQKNQFWFWTYLQNWTLIFNYDGKATALNHFWSLAVEEQFYVIWPFVIITIKNVRKLLLICIVTLLMIIMARLAIWHNRDLFPSYNWLFLFTRVDGILIGSMLSIVYQKNPQLVRKYTTILVLSLAGLNFFIYFIPKQQSFPVWPIAGYTTFSAIFAILVYESVLKENHLISFIFNNSLLRFLGKYSYGFYIFHWPIFLIVKPYTDLWAKRIFELQGNWYLLPSSILATLAGLTIAFASFHIFEKHFLKLKSHFA